jgi:uncharacterized protein (DUF934 family)
MPTLLRLEAGAVRAADDAYIHLSDEDALPAGPVIVSSARFQAEAESLLADGRKVGVRLKSDEPVEGLAYDLPRLALVALEFPKFRDGRAYTAARLLRDRYGFKGEVRAVGDVLLEQSVFMARCGFDAVEPADGTTAEQWTARLGLHRHVYAAASDARVPAFVERAQ